jgi:hypothetical protein
VTSISDSHLAHTFCKNIKTLENLSKTLNGIMKNVVSEISRHREDIFKALDLQDISGNNEESKLMDRNSLFSKLPLVLTMFF